MSKINLGIEGLNEVLGGGLTANKAYLISGNTGVGKTIFCLQFIYAGLKAGDSAVYLTIDEKPADIIDDAKSLGWDLDKYIKNKKLYFMDLSKYATIDVSQGEALDVRRMMSDLTEHIHKISAKRVVIECIDYITLHTAESELNAEEYLREVILYSTNLDTVLMTSLLPSTPKELSVYGMVERLVHGVITLELNEQNNKRFLYIRKMRKTGVELAKYEYSISAKGGIHVESVKREAKILRVGDSAPNFTIDAYYNNQQVRLSSLDYRGKWLVLVFYPGDFTFVCPTELSGIAEKYKKFKSLNAEVISISMNTISSHKTWKDTSPKIANIKYPMGADVDGTVCSLFGVLKIGGTAERAAFIIDPDGTIVAQEITDERIGRSVDELLRKLSAAKYVREHPKEMCPEGWKPGKKSIKV